VGGTAARLGMLFGGPLLLCALSDRLRRPPPQLLLVAVAGFAVLAYWQWTSAIRDIDKALSDPAAESSYFEPLRQFLVTLPDQRRIEIPFTSSRWENAEVAPLVPLARGWLRQLDTKLNPIFYREGLNRITYASWLADNAGALCGVAVGEAGQELVWGAGFDREGVAVSAFALEVGRLACV